VNSSFASFALPSTSLGTCFAVNFFFAFFPRLFLLTSTQPAFIVALKHFSGPLL